MSQMTRKSAFIPILVAAGLLAAAIFALERFAGMDEARSASLEAHEQLDLARELAREHPEAYGDRAAAGSADLKRLVQESGARNGVSILYLTEVERDAGDSIRERNVTSRIVNVPHGRLVAFLADLEARGGGARVKEIRMKPANDRSDIYQEAEAVLAIRFPIEKGAGKEKTK